MKKTIFFLLLCLDLNFINPVLGKDAGHGRLNMRGSIIESACTIDMNSLNQTVDLGVITVGELERNGRSSSIPFSINLINCTLKKLNPSASNWRYFEITFDGENHNGLFINKGSSQGVGVALSDEKFKPSLPGIPLSQHLLSEGGISIKYYLSLTHDAGKIKAGDFNTSIKYKIDYF